MRSGLAVMSALSLSGVIASGCAMTQSSRLAAVAEAPTLTIERVSLEPKTVEAGTRDTAAIRFTLTRVAMVRVDLVDDEGRVVRTLEGGARPLGSQSMSWDGRDTQGRPVAGGVYRYVIHAQDAHGTQTAVYDPSMELGGEELEPRDFTYDPHTGLMRWVMPKAGYARLRVGVEGFPHLRTLLDWEPLEGGAQTLAWDGLDASGLIAVKDHPNLSMKLKAFAMPPNAIIVQGEPSTTTSEATPIYPSMMQRATASFHARHPRAACHEIRLRLEFPGATHDAEGRPVLVGIAPVRVMFDERDAAWAVNERFELAVFEDLTVIVEEEKGTTPYTYLLDTASVPPGPHLLTVNVLSGRDHYGVQTRQIVIGVQP